MRFSARSLIGGLLIFAALGAALAARAQHQAAARHPSTTGGGLHVQGNRLLYGSRLVQLRGVNRSGLEYQCIQNEGFFESPTPGGVDSQAMIAAMVRWNINAVRVPLNEDCWLGVNAPRRYSGSGYRRIVEEYVHELERAHLFVILDLHWSAPGRSPASGQYRMADREHSPAFWRSVSAAFRRDGQVIFDLFNEPQGVSWTCWLHGCRIPAAGGEPAYQTAGMQQLVNAVRSSGARQPLMLGGIGLALDLSGWLGHEPHDPLHQLIASEHSYGGPPVMCDASCQSAIVSTRRRVPVVMGELGESDCGTSYIDRIMRFADAHGVGYLGWAWDLGGGWKCSGGQQMISDWAGDPTPYGAGFRSHFLSLRTPFRPR